MKSKLLLGNCLDRMQDLLEDSIDCVVTDPPYGYQFMNKEWDIDVPSVEIWKGVYRVLKPGGFIFVMSAPRSDVQLKMTDRIKDAGFDISFTPIYWAYASGFCKGMNMYKAIDDRYLNEWFEKKYGYQISQVIKKYRKCAKEKKEQKNVILSKMMYWKRKIKVLWAFKEYGKELGEMPYEHPGRRDRSYQTTANVFSGDRKEDALVPFQNQSEKTNYLDILKERKSKDEYQNTEYTRQNPYHDGPNLMKEESGLKKALMAQSQLDENEGEITLLPWEIPITPEAEQAFGSYAGFQPKPAVEVIIVAMKPLSEKTYIDQFFHNGKGVSWLNECRIPYREVIEAINANKKGYATQVDSAVFGWNNGSLDGNFWASDEGKKLKKHLVGGRLNHGYTIAGDRLDGYKLQDFDLVDPNLKGRVPANLIVSDRILSTDDHDFSKYFDLDLWYQSRINSLPKEQQQTYPFLYCPKPSRTEKNKGLTDKPIKQSTDGCIRTNSETARKYGANPVPKRNFHPTTKPVDLMRYIILLGSARGECVLDPFCGSGTTCVAAKLEDRTYIGIEMNPEYYEIMKARVHAVKKHKKLTSFF